MFFAAGLALSFCDGALAGVSETGSRGGGCASDDSDRSSRHGRLAGRVEGDCDIVICGLDIYTAIDRRGYEMLEKGARREKTPGRTVSGDAYSHLNIPWS